MNNLITSLIRTYVPIIVGSVISFLAVEHGFAVEPDIQNQLVAGLTGVIIAAYYLVARLLERKFPELGVLLGSKQKPTYVEPTKG
jgi:hypothetical protein